MSVAGIKELHAGVCELACIAPDGLVVGEHGNSSFSLRVHDVPMTVVHYSARAEMVYLIVTMGKLPDDLLLKGARALLNANVVLLGSDPQVFGRDPDTGDCVLHCAFALEAITATDLYQRISHLAAFTNRWRTDYFLSDVPEASAGFATMHDAAGLHP